MKSRTIAPQMLIEMGIGAGEAPALAERIDACLGEANSARCWRALTREALRPDHPFELHRYLHRLVFEDWDPADGPAPAWIPDPASIDQTNLGRLMQETGLTDYRAFHAWTVSHYDLFWRSMIERMHIVFKKKATDLVDLAAGIESPTWLPGARLNIADSCFGGDPDVTAVIHQNPGGPIERMSLGELERLSNRVANGLVAAGFKAGDTLAIVMPMNVESVAIYLGVVKAGCAVVSIADSFAPPEIRTRLRIANCAGVFTQDYIHRGGKRHGLFERVLAAEAPRAIMLRTASDGPDLRTNDLAWDDFLASDDRFESVACDPDDAANILFSSGTTGDPKAIPWTHTTPIKCAVDGCLHQDIRPGDVVAWPTNLGWMMGPWLIFAALMNRAAIALYGDAPTGREFGRFVQDARVTMLGVVPSLVNAWRTTECMKGLDWSAVKTFSSTGEPSNRDDMLYLMSLAGYRPVIEYCGGTEIGGGYITGTHVQPSAPGTFSTASVGLDYVILDEGERPATEGELFLVPPSIGLSNRLLNKDHHDVYFANAPAGPGGKILRRHGDRMRTLGNGYVCAQGRIDDTMNLSGIKVGSTEIERILNRIDGVDETAAITISPPDGGPGNLVIFTVVGDRDATSPEDLKAAMQRAIRAELNPLFRIHDVAIINSLPRTASNKVMRRVLRETYRKTNPDIGGAK